jgi:hypothetical protein
MGEPSKYVGFPFPRTALARTFYNDGNIAHLHYVGRQFLLALTCLYIFQAEALTMCSGHHKEVCIQPAVLKDTGLCSRAKGNMLTA